MSSNLKRVIRENIRKLDLSDMDTIPAVIEALKNAGAIKDVHVGRDSLSSVEILEWYAGQIISVLENNEWTLVNTLINYADGLLTED